MMISLKWTSWWEEINLYTVKDYIVMHAYKWPELRSMTTSGIGIYCELDLETIYSLRVISGIRLNSHSWWSIFLSFSLALFLILTNYISFSSRISLTANCQNWFSFPLLQEIETTLAHSNFKKLRKAFTILVTYGYFCGMS